MHFNLAKEKDEKGSIVENEIIEKVTNDDKKRISSEV